MKAIQGQHAAEYPEEALAAVEALTMAVEAVEGGAVASTTAPTTAFNRAKASPTAAASFTAAASSTVAASSTAQAAASPTAPTAAPTAAPHWSTSARHPARSGASKAFNKGVGRAAS
jgi:hypothetical protein